MASVGQRQLVLSNNQQKAIKAHTTTKHVKETINIFFNKLSKDNYNMIIPEFRSSHIFQNERYIRDVVNNVIDRAEREGRYLQEIYAIFCEEIINSKQLTFVVKREFHRQLLDLVQAKFRTEIKPLAMKHSLVEYKQRKAIQCGSNILCLIGELYNRKLIMDTIAHHVVKTLLLPHWPQKDQTNEIQIQYPTEAGVEMVGSFFYVVGPTMDQQGPSVHMDLYFRILQTLQDFSDYTERTKFFISDLMDARQSKWTINHRENTFRKALSQKEANQAYQDAQNAISDKARQLRQARLRRQQERQKVQHSKKASSSSSVPTKKVTEPTVDEFICRALYHIQSYLEETDEDPISEIMSEMPYQRLAVYIVTAVLEVGTTCKAHELTLLSKLLELLLKKNGPHSLEDRKLLEGGYTKFIDRVLEKELYEDCPSLFIQAAKVLLPVLPDAHGFLLHQFVGGCTFHEQAAMRPSIIANYLTFLVNYAGSRRDTIGFNHDLFNLNIIHLLRKDFRRRGKLFLSNFPEHGLILSCQALSILLHASTSTTTMPPSSYTIDGLKHALSAASKDAFTSVFTVFVMLCSPTDFETYAPLLSTLFYGPSQLSSTEQHASFMSQLEALHRRNVMPLPTIASLIHLFSITKKWLPIHSVSHWLDHLTLSSSFAPSLRRNLLDQFSIVC